MRALNYLRSYLWPGLLFCPMAKVDIAVEEQFVVPHSNSKGTVSFSLSRWTRKHRQPEQKVPATARASIHLDHSLRDRARSQCLRSAAGTEPCSVDAICCRESDRISLCDTIISSNKYFSVGHRSSSFIIVHHHSSNKTLAYWLNTSLCQGFLCGHRTPLPRIAIYLATKSAFWLYQETGNQDENTVSTPELQLWNCVQYVLTKFNWRGFYISSFDEPTSSITRP